VKEISDYTIRTCLVNDIFYVVQITLTVYVVHNTHNIYTLVCLFS